MTPINNYLTQQERRIGRNKNAAKDVNQSTTSLHRPTSQGGLVSRLMRALVSKDSRTYASQSTITQSVPGEVI